MVAHRTEVSAQNYEARGRRATPSLGVINKRATAFNDDVSIEDVFEDKLLSQALCFDERYELLSGRLRRRKRW